MDSYVQWFEKGVSAVLSSKDEKKISELSAEMKKIGLLFNQLDPIKIRGNDCATEAGDGGTCDNNSCLLNAGGDCDNQSCMNASDGGDCGTTICSSCSSSV